MTGRDERAWPFERLLPPLVGGVGLVLVVTGTFLPWLRSGSHQRNSYQAGGAVRRLLNTSGFVDRLLSFWPFVGIACAAAAALFLVGLRTLGTFVAAVAGLGAGAAAIAALATTASSVVQVDVVGPATTLTGATLVALAVLFRALSAAAAPRSSS